MGAELTLGAEEELHLIDLQRWHLSARAPQVLSRLPEDSCSAEIQRTTVETNTAVVTSLSTLGEELVRLRRGAIDVAARDGLGLAAVGTAPRSGFADFELTATGRYARMQQQYRLLGDEQLISGTQVHVGVSDRDLAVEIAQRVGRDLPVLLALSASSPYWNGQDTGYASIRTIIWQRWPSAGATGPLASAREYDELLAGLVDSGVIADAKMAYFDVRPSAHAPTLELRVCDACPVVDDAVLIAGLFRALVRALVDRLRPQLEELGDWQDVPDLAEATLARGNSADRQRAVLAERGEVDDVMRLVVEETSGPAGGAPPAGPALRRYPVRAGDEAVGTGALPRPAYRDVVERMHTLGTAELERREAARDEWARRHSLTFGVAGEERPFVVDLVPRVVNGHEWRELKAGLVQRARAIECFLRDVYGEQRVLADGVLSAAAGTTVFAPKVRGSSGSGREFVHADDLHGRYAAFEDVLAAGDHLVGTGVAAPGRVAVTGRSYGGYLTLACLAFFPDAFAAGVDVCGMSDLTTFYRDTEPWIGAAAVAKYGHPERDRALLEDISPLASADRIRVPLLVVHGELDTNVPIGEAHQVVAALRGRDHPVDYLELPGEGHEYRRAESRKRLVAALVRFLAGNLGPRCAEPRVSPGEPDAG